jgi:hypothetical protein
MNENNSPTDKRDPAGRLDERRVALDAAIARGIADANSGAIKSIQAVFDRLEAKYRLPR